MHTRLLKIARQSEVPVCLKCLQPHDPYLHRCPHCFAAVGQFVPNLPVEGIPFEADFYGNLWRKTWSSSTAFPLRIAFLALIIVTAPYLLLGLPFALLKKDQPTTSNKAPSDGDLSDADTDSPTTDDPT